jgi:plastocyanin
MRLSLSTLVPFVCASLLAACGGNGSSTPSTGPTAVPTAGPTAAPTTGPTAAPTTAPTAQPQVIHVGFNHTETTDATLGPVYFYAMVASGPAQVIRVKTGSQVVFTNDDPSGVTHTAGGFGSASFPVSFDNSNRHTQAGTAIDGGTTWSTGDLSPGQTSQAFTIPAAGTYYFGCGFHYTTVPTTTNSSMGDILVAS